MMKSRSRAWALGALLLVPTVPTDTIAQPAPKSNPSEPVAKPVPKPPAPGDHASAPQAPAGLQVSIEQILYLTRSTLLTLNDANHSGNYSVLRDLAAPEFQAKNSAADLAVSFTDLRRRNFDLYAAALIVPQLTEAPAIDADGKLHLSGVFPTRPLQIKFDLLFAVSTGQWKLFGIAIATPDAPPLAAQAPEQKQGQRPTTKFDPKATTVTPPEPGKRSPDNAPR
jgi:hypothetical protein